MSRDIIAQLKDLKNHPSAGWVNDVEQELASTRLLTAIGHHDGRVIEGAGIAYMKWNSFSFVTRPVGVSLVIFALLFGGWFTTVKAAVGSIPGDTLYGVKLMTEQAQLMIASSDNRAVLHTQFAQRRMVEIQTLQTMDDGRTEKYMQETMHALEAEVIKAGDALSQMKLDGQGDVLTVASVLDEKISTIQAELGVVNGQDVAVSEAQLTTNKVSNSAVDALMDVHEVQVSDQSEAALSRSFKNEYTDLRERQTFDLGRVQTIGQVIAENELLGIVTTDDLKRLEFAVNQATDDVAGAMNLFVAGGYRNAFDILRSSDTTLLDIEAQLVVIENNIMTAMDAIQQDQIADEVVEVEEVVDDQNIEVNQIINLPDQQITQ
ncbi:hypothetical protein KJ673_02175 [Patescibacteria group bacterium]|nr:hypothetical protein [Patescibacteria group bacterium]MBU4453148.1 hypothetical protein [Patescibacteria group bacterium]MCG2687357.1 DUF5667 domain-containing protein [Candidatus Parcubacteria bacterium]